ncbi:DNA ligase [Desulfococcaceae bacterium HSG9]|nr:DNA ligase [Desulfococcaceae bacterium HSG9]
MKKIKDIVEKLQQYNAAYRSGSPLVSDAAYDTLTEELRQLQPDHPFLQAVEPELLSVKKEVRHPTPMLSTEKAYTSDDLVRYVNRVTKAAEEIGVQPVHFKVMPKLDGLAGRDDGVIFATRGNGLTGYEISSAFEKGVLPFGGRGLGLGEIVILQSYFNIHLAEHFEHPRNMVVGIIASDTLNDLAKLALKDQAVHFVPYTQLPNRTCDGDELIKNMETITAELTAETDYPIDGMVAEVTDPDIKQFMGATSHHYRWQIAIKKRGATAMTVVEAVSWQVGRTGNVTPVLEITPISLSGATIKRVTAHHAGMIREKQIGSGAEIEISRSGEVIPKLEKVIQPAVQTELPEKCPVCQASLQWQNDFLKCVNPHCQAQTEQRINHWFKTLGNADWFGIKTIQKMVASGYESLEKIYAMTEADFAEIEFGPVQSRNLAQALQISRTKQVEDWRFLAAFGIPDLGRGDSRKLLAHIRLEDIVKTKAAEIEKIYGFGTITSQSVANGIAAVKETFQYMLKLNFNLERTPQTVSDSPVQSAITGKKIVFTGKMAHGNRKEMQAQARKLGATVQKAVSGKTDMLVCGAKVGAAKIAKAEKADVAIISETEYLLMIEH